MRFTKRFEASKGDRAAVLEDAPRPTRIGFIKGILVSIVGDNETYGSRKEPLETTEVHRAFIALIRDEADPWDYDVQSAWAALTHHLKQCEWTEFFDFVELLGALLIKKEADGPFDDPEYFKEYQTAVNALFHDDGIGWTLNDKSELYRQVPKALAKRISGSESLLVDRFDAARVHYQKALTYLHQHPIDEANSIKEIVSALESVSRVIVPKASTLGDAIKHMRKNDKYSSHLIDALEKLYAFSNVTPLVRHGHPTVRTVLLPEAELALFTGAAFIRYLIDMEKENLQR
jgi:hypothetical protein